MKGWTCESIVRQTIYMKCQALIFFLKNTKQKQNVCCRYVRTKKKLSQIIMQRHVTTTERLEYTRDVRIELLISIWRLQISS